MGNRRYLLNIRVGRKTQLVLSLAWHARSVSVVGAGPAGLAAAVNIAQRGHQVTLFEANDFIGGQFDMARHITGEQEFNETSPYVTTMLGKHGIVLRLSIRVSAGRRDGVRSCRAD